MNDHFKSDKSGHKDLNKMFERGRPKDLDDPNADRTSSANSADSSNIKKCVNF